MFTKSLLIINSAYILELRIVILIVIAPLISSHVTLFSNNFVYWEQISVSHRPIHAEMNIAQW